MPWCDRCDRFLTPSSLDEQGACPGCHTVLEAPTDADRPKVPWHFWVLVAALTLYLGWRLLQGVLWSVGRL